MWVAVDGKRARRCSIRTCLRRVAARISERDVRYAVRKGGRVRCIRSGKERLASDFARNVGVGSFHAHCLFNSAELDRSRSARTSLLSSPSSGLQSNNLRSSQGICPQPSMRLVSASAFFSGSQHVLPITDADHADGGSSASTPRYASKHRWRACEVVGADRLADECWML